MKKDMTKNHTRNRLMDAYLRGAATYSTIIKIEHFEAQVPSGSTDFQPLVVYSLNKKKRWENLESVENSEDDDVKVFIFERETRNLMDGWWCLQSGNYSEPYNFSKAINTNLMDLAKKQEKVVGYHVIRFPKNFKTIFDKKCIRYRGLRYPDFLGYCISGNIKRWENTIVIEDERLEVDFEEEEEEVVEETDTKETVARTPGFYNLEDHIVVKKPRKHVHKGWKVV